MIRRDIPRRWLGVVVASCLLTGLLLPPTAGARAQTTLPPETSLSALGRSLFIDVVRSNVPAARSLFFPKSAYIEMKTKQIPDPASDYDNRLLAFYALDLAAYHRFLGRTPAHYLRTTFLVRSATWIAPGVCENVIGYWHEPTIRIVYTQAGVVKSFGVDSLISWRGRYFVVHLGPNPRAANVGTVDQPSRGAGVPGPAGGC